MPATRQKCSWHRIHTSTLVASVILFASLIVLNATARAPVTQRSQNSAPVTETTIVDYGWPFVAFQSVRMFEDGKRVPWQLLGVSTWPNGDAQINMVGGIVANVLVGIGLILSAAITTEYWVRHRRGPFRFRLRTLFGLTTIACVFLSLLRGDILQWTQLLFLPIGFGCAATVIVAALALEQWFSWSDAKLARAREKFVASEEGR